MTDGAPADEQPAEMLRLRPEAVTWRMVEGEVVALDIDESEYLATNETGGAMWQALAAGTSEAQMVALLVERYGAEQAAAEQDVRAFVDQLRERDLLQ